MESSVNVTSMTFSVRLPVPNCSLVFLIDAHFDQSNQRLWFKYLGGTSYIYVPISMCRPIAQALQQFADRIDYETTSGILSKKT